MSGAAWQPGVDRAQLQQRAATVAAIRAFFAERGVCEVTTPVLVPTPSVEPTLVAFALDRATGPGFLRTSPESALKRLLAAGSGDVYELGPVFRAGERGRLHLPEFTLLEWYRTGFDHHRLMDEVAALCAATGLARPIARLSYAELFEAVCGEDPHAIASARLAELARALPLALDADAAADRAGLFDALYVHRLEPALARRGAVFLHDFPQELRAYARLADDAPPRAERFELIVDGVEIANGYHEITDAAEQAACFAAENALRARRGLRPVSADTAWLAALAHGLPPCAGVALGLERLLLVLAGAGELAAVTAFATAHG